MQMFYSASTGGFYDLDFEAYTLPADAVPVTPSQYQALLAGNAQGQIIKPDATGHPTLVALPPPTPAQIQASLGGAVQGLLDSWAKSKGYESILSMVSYIGDANATFAGEAAKAVAYRSAVWSKVYQVQSAVQAGTQVVPTPAALLAMLPGAPF